MASLLLLSLFFAPLPPILPFQSFFHSPTKSPEKGFFLLLTSQARLRREERLLATA